MHLLTPFQLGSLSVPNRVFLAPLTRTRCDANNVPTDLVVKHYVQRASGGLLFAEATMVSADSQAWLQQPSIHSPAHIAGWRRVTEAVHAAGGRIFLQLWHPGRATHEENNGGTQPVSSSNKPIRDDHIHTPKGKRPYPAPRPLRLEEIPLHVEHFRRAAENALAAGFDGVQLHGAHGYLIDQFLRDGVNDRTDAYGGSIANRARFLFETVDAAIGIFGADRVGLRISPRVPFNDMIDSDPAGLVRHVAIECQRRRLGHLELRQTLGTDPEEIELARLARAHFHGPLLRNGGFTRESGEQAIADGLADAIVYGTAFLANPDLPRRFLLNAPINPVQERYLYTHGPEGYIDYPALPV